MADMTVLEEEAFMVPDIFLAFSTWTLGFAWPAA